MFSIKNYQENKYIKINKQQTLRDSDGNEKKFYQETLDQTSTQDEFNDV